MTIVVDTNVIFSLLRSGSSERILNVLFNVETNIYAPNLMLFEILKHQSRLRAKSQLSEDDFLKIAESVIEQINFISSRHLAFENLSYAFRLCKDVDEKDTLFVALALQLDCPLWTHDKPLISGLRERGFDNFFGSFRSLLADF